MVCHTEITQRTLAINIINSQVPSKYSVINYDYSIFKDSEFKSCFQATLWAKKSWTKPKLWSLFTQISQKDYNFPSKIKYILLILSSISNMFLKMFPWWISAEDDSHFLLNHMIYTKEHNDIIPIFYHTILCPIILASIHSSDIFSSSNSHTYLLA